MAKSTKKDAKPAATKPASTKTAAAQPKQPKAKQPKAKAKHLTTLAGPPLALADPLPEVLALHKRIHSATTAVDMAKGALKGRKEALKALQTELAELLDDAADGQRRLFDAQGEPSKDVAAAAKGVANGAAKGAAKGAGKDKGAGTKGAAKQKQAASAHTVSDELGDVIVDVPNDVDAEQRVGACGAGPDIVAPAVRRGPRALA